MTRSNGIACILKIPTFTSNVTLLLLPIIEYIVHRGTLSKSLKVLTHDLALVPILADSTACRMHEAPR